MELCKHGMHKHICRTCEFESVLSGAEVEIIEETEIKAEVRSVKWGQLETLILTAIMQAKEDKDKNQERTLKWILKKMDELQEVEERFIANYLVGLEGKDS